jgi:hypothetical protein
MKNRLLWLLLAVIVFDFGITLIGQPSSYWHDPHTAREGNPLFAWFMVRGLAWYLAGIVCYVAGVACLVRFLPSRPGLITGLVFLLAHYFAGCTWLMLRFDLGMTGPVIYAVVIAVGLVSIVQSGISIDCADNKKCLTKR